MQNKTSLVIIDVIDFFLAKKAIYLFHFQLSMNIIIIYFTETILFSRAINILEEVARNWDKPCQWQRVTKWRGENQEGRKTKRWNRWDRVDSRGQGTIVKRSAGRFSGRCWQDNSCSPRFLWMRIPRAGMRVSWASRGRALVAPGFEKHLPSLFLFLCLRYIFTLQLLSLGLISFLSSPLSSLFVPFALRARNGLHSSVLLNRFLHMFIVVVRVTLSHGCYRRENRGNRKGRKGGQAVSIELDGDRKSVV